MVQSGLGRWNQVGLDSEVGSPSRENLARLEDGAGLEHKLGVAVRPNEGEDSARLPINSLGWSCSRLPLNSLGLCLQVNKQELPQNYICH